MLNKWFKTKASETEESKIEETESTLPVSGLENKQEPVLQRQSHKKQALKVVNNYVVLSGGVGLIPVPLFDQVAIAGLLAKMLNDLCKIYHVKLSDHAVKAIVVSVLGGAHSNWITYPVTQNLVKLAPGLSLVGSFITRPIISGMIAYSIGRLFIHHFESGAWC